MITKGSLARYINPFARPRDSSRPGAGHRMGLNRDDIYLVVSDPYQMPRLTGVNALRDATWAWRCKVLVNGRKVIVEVNNLEKVE